VRWTEKCAAMCEEAVIVWHGSDACATKTIAGLYIFLDSLVLSYQEERIVKKIISKSSFDSYNREID